MPANLLVLTVPGVDSKIYPVDVNAHFALNEPYEFNVRFYCLDPVLHQRPGLLGAWAFLDLQYMHRADHWSGIITACEVDKAPTLTDYYCYQIRVQPTYALLQQTKNVRSFVKNKLPDIIKQVMAPLGTVQLDFSACSADSLGVLPYVIQYQETDFNFLQRLFESLGIGYFFSFEKKNYVMHFFDNNSALQPIKPLHWSDQEAPGQVYDYSMLYKTFSGGYRVRYMHPDAQKARYECIAKTSDAKQYIDVDINPYCYRPDADETEKYMQCDVELLLAASQVANTTLALTGSCVGVRPGASFLVPKDVGAGYFYVRSAHYEMNDYSVLPNNLYQKPAQQQVKLQVNAHPIANRYVPCRDTPIPKQVGALKGKVIGPEGQAIFTDKKTAAVKVHFVWDENNETQQLLNAPWVRVLQASADRQFGLQFMPRVGQEVICLFENGRLEQPVVVAAHRNKLHSPLDKKKIAYKTGWQTHILNTEDSNQGHHLLFDDTKGHENISIYSPGNLYETVVGEKKTAVKSDQVYIVENGDMTVSVQKGEMLLKAQKFIELQVGSSKIRLDSRSITLQAKTIAVSGDTSSAPFKQPEPTKVLSKQQAEMHVNILKGGHAHLKSQQSSNFDVYHARERGNNVKHKILKDKAAGNAVDNEDVREWYNHQVAPISSLNQQWMRQGDSLVDRSKKAYEIRHKARVKARAMMSNKRQVAQLQARDEDKYGHPDGPSYDQLLEEGIASGLTEEESRQKIIDSSDVTDHDTNKKYRGK